MSTSNEYKIVNVDLEEMVIEEKPTVMTILQEYHLVKEKLQNLRTEK